MVSRTAKLIVRAVRMAPVVACMFAGCTCSEKPVDHPTPIVAAVTRTPTSAARPTDTALPFTPTMAATQPAEASPSAGAGAAATADSAKQALCTGYVATLSGRAKNPASLNNAEFRALGLQSTDLVTCGAVLSNSDDLCKQLMPNERGPSKVCPHMRSIFNELRTYPKGRGFMVDDVDWQEWQLVHALAPASFDAFREVVRAGDASKCSQTGDLQSICKAYITLDKSLCRVQGKLVDAEVQFPDPKRGEPARLKIKEPLEDGCKRTIESRAFLAQGLEVLAKSGPPHERELAKAALGQADACASLAQAAVESCMQVSVTPAAGGTPVGPPVAAADQKSASQTPPAEKGAASEQK